MDWSASTSQSTPLVIPASSAVVDEIFTPLVGGETVIWTRGIVAYGSDQGTATET